MNLYSMPSLRDTWASGHCQVSEIFSVFNLVNYGEFEYVSLTPC